MGAECKSIVIAYSSLIFITALSNLLKLSTALYFITGLPSTSHQLQLIPELLQDTICLGGRYMQQLRYISTGDYSLFLSQL